MSLEIYNQFVDGRNTIYESVIESLRDNFGTIKSVKELKGGAIIFFTKKVDEKLMVKVFPFKRELGIFKLSESHLSEKERNDLLQKLNTDKPYNDFAHYEKFRTENKSQIHFITTVDDRNVLKYDHKEQKLQFPGFDLTWKEFYKMMMKGEIEKNTYEQLFFDQGCNQLIYLPLPVLSTPFIFLVLDNTGLDQNDRYELARLLYFRSRDTVSKYLYSRIIDNLSEFLLKYGDAISEKTLVDLFVKELSDVLLPISYTINDDPPQVYYDQWPSTDPVSEYTLHLSINDEQGERAYNIVFNLTSFRYINLDGKDENDYPWFHTSIIYKANIRQSSFLITKLFKLVHQYWRSLNRARQKANNIISEAIAGIKFDELVTKAIDVRSKLERLEIDIKSHWGYTPVNQILVDEDGVILTINHVSLITKETILKQNQLAGFMYLEFLLRNASHNGDSFDIDTINLFREIGLTRNTKQVPAAAKKIKHDSFISEQAEKIEDIAGFISEHKKEIAQFVNKGTEVKTKGFYEGFCYYARLHQEVKYHKGYNTSTEKNIAMDKLFKKYNEIDPEKTHHDIVNAINVEDKKTNNITRSKYDGENPERYVYDCFKSLVDKLKQLEEKPGKKAAVKLFIDNLVASGLIKEENHLPVRSNRYSYSQKNINPRITWDF